MIQFIADMGLFGETFTLLQNVGMGIVVSINLLEYLYRAKQPSPKKENDSNGF